jgi:hypothetical protein
MPGDTPIDFLKVDVEGFEGEVLRSNNWDRWRPRVIVVECLTPHVQTSTHTQWEPLLLDAGYLPALFDGLNRFYVEEKDEALLPLLAAPANILDPFDAVEVVQLRAYVAQLEGAFARSNEWALSLNERVLWLHEQLSALGSTGEDSDVE